MINREDLESVAGELDEIQTMSTALASGECPTHDVKGLAVSVLGHLKVIRAILQVEALDGELER